MPPPPASSATRILRIITRLNIGGPAIQAITLSTRLAEYGFDTTLVHGRLGTREGDMRTILPEPDSGTIFMPSLQRPIAPWSDAATFWRLLALMRQVKPAIVHTHMAKAGALGRLAAMAYNAGPRSAPKAKLVHTYHGHVLEGYFSPVTAGVFIRLERMLAHRTDALIAVSPIIRRELLEDFRIGQSDRFHVVPLGFNLLSFAAVDDAFRRQARVELGLPPQAPVIAWVGRLTAIKQPELFLDAAHLVAREWPEAVFLIAGDGDLGAAVQSRVRALGLEERVRLLGWRGDLPTIYGAADVFMLSSRNEGTPVALIEAMASGLPTVSSDVGGVRDVVNDTSLGVLVPAGRAERLAGEASSLLGDLERRRRMGALARASVVGRFGFDRLANDLIALYRRSIESPSR